MTIDYGVMVFHMDSKDDDTFDIVKTQLRNQLFTHNLYHYSTILYECTRLGYMNPPFEFQSYTPEYKYTAQFLKKKGEPLGEPQCCINRKNERV